MSVVCWVNEELLGISVGTYFYDPSQETEKLSGSWSIHWTCSNKNAHLLFFFKYQSEINQFLRLSVHTYGKHTNNLCNFAYLKFHSAGVTIGYFWYIRFLRKPMEIWSDTWDLLFTRYRGDIFSAVVDMLHNTNVQFLQDSVYQK